MRDGLICKRRAWVAPLNENEIRPHPPVAACDIWTFQGAAGVDDRQWRAHVPVGSAVAGGGRRVMAAPGIEFITFWREVVLQLFLRG